jgi:hypothetical protein
MPANADFIWPDAVGYERRSQPGTRRRVSHPGAGGGGRRPASHTAATLDARARRRPPHGRPASGADNRRCSPFGRQFYRSRHVGVDRTALVLDGYKPVLHGEHDPAPPSFLRVSVEDQNPIANLDVAVRCRCHATHGITYCVGRQHQTRRKFRVSVTLWQR